MDKLTVEYIRKIDVNSYENPVIKLLDDHKKKLQEYNENLSNAYALIRTRRISGGSFRKLKTKLKKESYKDFSQELDAVQDFSMELLDKIIIWRKVFRLFPYRKPEVDIDVVLNVYPRFDLASIIGVAYISRRIRSPEIRKNLLYASYTREENEEIIRESIDKIRELKDFQTFTQRTRKLIDENDRVLEFAHGENKRFFRQIHEDFNFGFHWIAMYL